jgi:hypothetical protein
MPFQRALLLVAVCASLGLAADPPELRPLKGEKIKGDLVSLTNKEIVLQVNGKPVATPTEGTLSLQFRAPGNPTGAYSQVELTDGSVLRCSKVEFKKKDAILTLTSGQVATIPMTLLSQVMHEANDLKMVASWRELLEDNKKEYDVLVFKNDSGNLAYAEVTFYDASDDGKTIEYKLKGDEDKRKRAVEKIHGIIFSRQPDPNMPNRLCEVQDAQGARLFAKSANLKDGKVVVETQCGARVELSPDALAKLDYSKGKLTYLSDLVRDAPSKVKLEQAETGGEKYFFTDCGPEKGPMRLAGQVYDKGLAMHARTEVTFTIDGDYREFRAVLGIDDNYSQGSEDPVFVRVEANGKELKTFEVTRKAGAIPINLNIKDVNKLRIIVTSTPENFLGLGSSVDLADAKVSK